MAKIDNVNNNDSGLVARNKINEALKDITDEPLTALMDVIVANPVNNEVLAYDNGVWKNIPITVDATSKADKVIGATDGNFAGLDATGNLTDSGTGINSFATAAQGLLANTALQPGNNISELTNDSGFISDIVEDTTPELGGNLDVLGFEINSSTSNITLNPGANEVVISGTGTNIISTDASTDLFISPGGNLILDNITWPTSDGTSGQVITTDGNGNLQFTTVSGGGTSPVTSVFSRIGDIVAEESDYSSFYATTAQGALADTALQNINAESINDLADVSTVGVTNSQVLMWNGNNFVANDVVDPTDYLGKDIPTVELPDPGNPAETGDVKSITDIVNHLFMFASNGKKVIIDAGKKVSLPMEYGMTFDEIARVILSIDSVSFTITGTSTNTVWTDLVIVDVGSNAYELFRDSNGHMGTSVAEIDPTHEISIPTTSAFVELI